MEETVKVGLIGCGRISNQHMKAIRQVEGVAVTGLADVSEENIAALTADPAFNGGEYTSPPRKGLEAYGMVWLGWLYSQEWWRRELWKANSPVRTGRRKKGRSSFAKRAASPFLSRSGRSSCRTLLTIARTCGTSDWRPFRSLPMASCT